MFPLPLGNRPGIPACLLVILFCPSFIAAQPVTQAEHLLGMRYENDFFNATDQYFTQGVQFTYAAPFVARSPLAHVLLRWKDRPQQHALFIEQQCFTPSSIRRDTIFTGDRPFAAAMFIGHRATSTDGAKGRRLTSSLVLGVLGPCALCAEEQRGIHEALDNIEPLGWEFQLAGDAIINYAVQAEQRLLGLPFAEVAAGPQAELGTYRTNVGLGAGAEIGRFRSRFAGEAPIDRKFRASVFGEAVARLIGYDATLQGGLFNDDSPYTLRPGELERVVLSGRSGIKISYRRLELVGSRTFITREFSKGVDHGWGGFVLRYRW